MEYTQPEAATFERYAECLANAERVHLMAGDGIQAPGAIVLRLMPNPDRGYRVQWLNLQAGGFGDSSYDIPTRARALDEFAAMVRRYDPTRALSKAAAPEFADRTNSPDRIFRLSVTPDALAAMQRDADEREAESTEHQPDLAACRAAGAATCHAGADRTANPFERDSDEWEAWDSGFNASVADWRARLREDVADMYGDEAADRV